MMELYFSHPQPESMIVMTPTLHDYTLNQERITGTRRDKTLDYPGNFKRQRKWMQTSTGGLSGANSPFSNDEHFNHDISKNPVSPPTHPWDIVSTSRKYPSTEKTKDMTSRRMEVPGQPRDVIKNGYYKEFVAASLQKRFRTDISKNKRMIEYVDRTKQVIDYKNVNSDHEPDHKKLCRERADVEFGKTVSSSSHTLKTKEAHVVSHLRDRLKSLPPPPPLVRVEKIQLKNTQQNNQITKTVNTSNQEIRRDIRSERTASSSRKILRPQNFENRSAGSLDFNDVQIERTRRDSTGLWVTQANHSMENKFYVNKSMHNAQSNTSSRSFAHLASKNVNTGVSYPLMTTEDGTVYVTMDPSMCDINCTTQANTQATYRHSIAREHPSTRFQEIPIISKDRNNQFLQRHKISQDTSKQGIDLQKQFEIQRLRINEMRLGFSQAASIYSDDARMAQNLSNSDVIIIRDSPPLCQSHDMTSRVPCHPYSLQKNVEYHDHVQGQNQSRTPTMMKCYCRCCAPQSHIPGQRSSRGDLKQPPALTLSKNTPPTLSSSPRSSQSSSSLRPPSLVPPPLLPSSSSIPSSTSVKLLQSPKSSSISSSSSSSSSSSPTKSVPLASPKMPHDSFTNHLVYSSHANLLPSTSNTPEKVLVDASSRKKQYLQTSSSLISNKQYSSHETNTLYHEATPRLPLLQPKSPSFQDKNKAELLPFAQKPQRRMTYPLASQLKDVERKATLKRACSEGDKDSHSSNNLSSEKLLQIPIEEEKDVGGKSYGGFAYDHESLPIIIAVHSIAADTPQSAQNHNNCNEKTKDDSAELLKKKSFEVPSQCLTTTDDSKEDDPAKVLSDSAGCRQSVENEQPLSRSADVRASTIQDVNITSNKLPSPKSAETEIQSPKNTTEERISENMENSDGSAVATSKENTSPKTATGNCYDSKEISDNFSESSSQSDTKYSLKRPPQEKSVALLSKKILETREKIKNEKIDWKKKLLCKLETILIKRLRKAEVITGVNATIDLPTIKPSEKHAKTSQKSDKKKNEGSATDESNSNDSKPQKTNEKRGIKKHRKLKKVVASLTTEEDELISDCELTIEETQEPHDEENSADSINASVKEDLLGQDCVITA